MTEMLEFFQGNWTPGLRIGEALKLEWPNVHLEPAKDASYGIPHRAGLRREEFEVAQRTVEQLRA